MTLVWDKSLVKRFIREVVPEPRNDEVYICVLVCRKKYSNKISRSEEMLDKLIVKHKEDLPRKIIKFLRIEKGDYIDFRTKRPIPLEALAAYIDLYPKSSLKALGVFNSLTFQWTYQGIVDKNFGIDTFKKLTTKWFSSLAKSTSRKPVKIIDVDKKYVNILHEHETSYNTIDDEHINNMLNLPKLPDWITFTRGGYHLIYKEPDRNITNKLSKLPKQHDFVEIGWHQAQTPIPGTIQGGAKVLGYKVYWG